MKTQQQIIDLINQLFSDTSVSPDVTRAALEEICDHCQANIDAIVSDYHGVDVDDDYDAYE